MIDTLTSDYLAPSLNSHGLELESDGVLRAWGEGRKVCAVVSLFRYAGDYPPRVTVEFGFYSSFIREQFGLAPVTPPTAASANGAGLYYRLENLLGMKVGAGWVVADVGDVRRVGTFLQETVPPRFAALWPRLSTHAGWAREQRNLLASLPARRGYHWALLGYSLLACSETTFEEMREVILAHEAEKASRKTQNRLDVHIERQRRLVEQRFGRVV
ncbi:MAG: hypothetical protein D6731_11675 [Planctomycetota bacterium]|nr:MAG: hypothetical protein D6731_11675 [Planctomycetota bacterium]